MTKNKAIRLLFSLLLITVGAILILLSAPGTTGELLSKLGLAFIVAGVVSSFHELVIRASEGEDNANTIASKVFARMKGTPLSAVGIRLVSPIRKGYAGYYLWAVDNYPQEMFFAGRSVLHRIDADFRDRHLGTVEQLIMRRLSEGASFKILFLDPRSEMIPRLAREEGQTPNQLLGDLLTSLAICRRMYDALQTQRLPASAQLDVRVFDEIPYFAYHRTGTTVIVGFYFSSILGHSSAAFEVVDPQTRDFFDGHFSSLFARAASTHLLRIDPHRKTPELDFELFRHLRDSLGKALGENKVDEALGRTT